MGEHFKVRPRYATSDLEIDSHALTGERVLVTPLTLAEAAELVIEISTVIGDVKNHERTVKHRQR
jgi:hypothetical protein